MLLAVNKLNNFQFLEAKKAGVRTFLFNEIAFIPDEKDECVFYNCTQNRIQGSWLTWDKNNLVIQSFFKKHPQFFYYNQYNLILAVQKAAFWSNSKTGFLHQSVINDFATEKIYFIEPFYQINRWKVIVKYLLAYFKLKRNKKPVQTKNNQFKGRIGIHIKDNFQLNLYKHVLIKIKNNSKFVVFFNSGVDSSKLDGIDSFQIKQNHTTTCLPWINPLFLNKDNLYVLNTIVNHKKELDDYVQQAEQIANTGVVKMLINEAENGHYGACYSEVFKNYNILTYNTMNGMKAGEAQDSHINFDQWFIWDEYMKKMMLDKTNLKENQLVVSGHLIEDSIKQHQFKNALPLDLQTLKNKKVISVFSVSGKRVSKLEAIDYLYQLLSDSDEYFLIIRPHPLEKEEDFVLPKNAIKNIYFVKYDMNNSIDTLHDQILISDIGVVFGSTVALECKWMGVPCITYEHNKESVIYNVDDENIFHVRTLNDFKSKLNDLLKNSQKKQLDSSSKVADFIIETLLKN
jgi:predicted transcriptional regulator